MKKTAKKVLFYICGLFILAAGINISKTAQLGISPVSAIPYAVELIWGIELGKSMTYVYLVLIVIQMILLRKEYKPIQLLQFVFTYVFGFFVTLTSRNYLLAWLPVPSLYIVKLIYLLISIVIIGIGVSFYLIPGIMPLPSEGLVNAIVEKGKGKYKFADIKVFVDSCLVAASALLSLIFLGGLKSVREGTILAALLIGKVVGFIFKSYKENIVEWFEK